MAIKSAQAEQLLEQMEKLPVPARYAILAAVGVLVVVLYWFAWGSGESKQLNVLHNQLTKLQNEIAEARAVASNLKSFQERREELQKQLNAALERLPNQRELPGLLTDMSGLGKKSGLEVRSFDPGEEQSRGFYAEVPIRVEFYGAYHDIGLFFDRLSKLSRIVNITEMTMELANDNADTPKLKVTGTATTFRFLEQKKKKKPGTAAGE